jgi:hypothetical protein
MTPYETAARWHLAHCPGESFRDVIEAHLFNGHLIAGPRLFLLGRRVSHTWPDELLRDPWQTDPDGDAWHVWLCAGDLRAIPGVVPYPLPWVTYHRRGRLCRARFSALLRSRAGQ